MLLAWMAIAGAIALSLLVVSVLGGQPIISL